MEEILSIKETSFKKYEKAYGSFVGFEIETNKQTIKLGISDGHSCCENYGYLMSEDDLSEFEGASLLGVDIVDTALNVEKLTSEQVSEGDCMFVNFLTSKGLLQFVAYNEHNGYYGHEVLVISNQINHETVL